MKRENWVETATVCDRGLVRAENQDAYFSSPAAGLFVVADGMGGGQGGSEASALVAKSFEASFGAADDLSTRLEVVRGTIASANSAILDFARTAGYRQTGSTVAALLLGDRLPGRAEIIWVGDSRVYRVRGGAIEALTNDHTVANELFGRGVRDAAGYSRRLPYAHVLTRALGVDDVVRPENRRADAQPGDRFLICSDGVHDMLPAERIEALVSSAASAQAGVQALAEAIRAAGAVDNFTATLVILKGTNT